MSSWLKQCIDDSVEEVTNASKIKMICTVDSPKSLPEGATSSASLMSPCSSGVKGFQDDARGEPQSLPNTSNGTGVTSVFQNASGSAHGYLCQTGHTPPSVSNVIPKPQGSAQGVLPPEQMIKMSSGSMCQGNMNQLCKVCGEPAAGFHFGAFTCEGCKSFFGRTYNNMSSLNECKNSSRCIINKKTRTSCKSCRLRKCLLVGMSKSGSRYGRRSNWFKIHYLMQNNNGTSSSVPSTLSSSMSSSSAPSSSTSMFSSSGHESSLVSNTATAVNHDSSSPMRDSPERKYLNANPKEYHFRPELKVHNPEFEVRTTFRSNSDVRGFRSPTPSSSESHLSETPMNLGDKNILSSYSDHLCPKNLLAIYSLPTLTPRLPAFMSHPSLAHRYLYPYYPSLFSAYSRQQYLNALLEEAKQRGTPMTDLPPDNSQWSSSSEADESPPPLKLFKPEPPQKISVAGEGDDHTRSMQEDNQKKCKALLSIKEGNTNPSHGIDPMSSQEDTGDLKASQTISKGESSPSSQDYPIDLSTRNASHTTMPDAPLICDVEENDAIENKEMKEVMNVEKKTIPLKSDQQTPLDLSSAKDR